MGALGVNTYLHIMGGEKIQKYNFRRGEGVGYYGCPD